jgi:hypothetical protein
MMHSVRTEKTHTGEMVLYSGHEEGVPYTQGVALILSKTAQGTFDGKRMAQELSQFPLQDENDDE